ncbi:MAG TPA: hypothetical protein VEB22_15360 [Phycisphaerales bacterium]|nr:hypothetical protein [Phycisphaerales bacterium]
MSATPTAIPLVETREVAVRRRLGLSWTPVDGVHVHAAIALTWADRIRVLLGQPVRVHVEVHLEREAGRAAAELGAHVELICASGRDAVVEG